MGLKDGEDLIFYGSGLSNQEMDIEFRKLYDSLIAYKENIFHLVDKMCKNDEIKDRLAMNIAERDCALIQRLVAKNCEQRQMLRKAEKKAVIEKIREDDKQELTVKDFLDVRTAMVMNNYGNSRK